MDINKFLENKSLAVIILGKFNPSIFQPYWLVKKGLIQDSEAEATKVNIIHNELVNFDLGWAKIDVTPERFQIVTTSEPHFLPLRDLVMGIFIYLKETPINAIGINYWFKLSLQTQEYFYEFGNKLAPLSNWDFLNNGRLISLEILDNDRKDGKKGHYRVRVESDQTLTYGVNVLTNNHFDLDESKSNNNDLGKVLKENWDEARMTALSYLDSIWNKINL